MSSLPSATTSFLEALPVRRSRYQISSTNPPISDQEVQDLVKTIIQQVPSSYNSQSGRAVLLFGESHHWFWDTVIKHVSSAVPQATWDNYLSKRIDQHKGGRGTIMFFEDEDALDRLKARNPMVTPLASEWSDTSNGMFQFSVWTAVSTAGLSASLQHFNFHPQVKADVLEHFDLPTTWKLKAQLVYGAPTGDETLPEKAQDSVEERVRVFA